MHIIPNDYCYGIVNLNDGRPELSGYSTLADAQATAADWNSDFGEDTVAAIAFPRVELTISRQCCDCGNFDKITVPVYLSPAEIFCLHDPDLREDIELSIFGCFPRINGCDICHGRLLCDWS